MSRMKNPTGVITGLVWCAGILFYLFFVRTPVSRAYIDFGDGNYQYISWRLTQGIRLYTDILSPQPPFHLWLGALLERAAGWIGCDPLLLYRWVIHLFRLLTSLLIGGIAWKLFRNAPASCLASLVFLILPEGYRWSHGYQSENLELFFLTTALYACLSRNLRLRNLAAALAVCSVWTNMSALPFAVLITLFAVRVRPVNIRPFIWAGAVLVLLFGVCWVRFGSDYMGNVWSNQVASIPTDTKAWISALHSEGTTIIDLEGLFILAGLLGLFRFLTLGENDRASESRWTQEERTWIVVYGIFSVGSAIYVVKGGTVDYIFMLAEPALSLFGAFILVQIFAPKELRTENDQPLSLSAMAVLYGFSRVLLVSGTVVLLLWVPSAFLKAFRFQASPGVDLPDTYQGRLIEFSDIESRTIQRTIRHLAEPGATIWSPPYFAAITKHPIALDLSETYLWYVRWQRSVWMEEQDEGVDRMITNLTKLLEKKTLPLLLLNSRTGQWGQLIIPNLTLRLPQPDGSSRIVRIRDLDPRLDRLQHAMERNYHPILTAPGSDERLYFQGMNERLEIWVPKERSPYLPPGILRTNPPRNMQDL